MHIATRGTDKTGFIRASFSQHSFKTQLSPHLSTWNNMRKTAASSHAPEGRSIFLSFCVVCHICCLLLVGWAAGMESSLFTLFLLLLCGSWQTSQDAGEGEDSGRPHGTHRKQEAQQEGAQQHKGRQRNSWEQPDTDTQPRENRKDFSSRSHVGPNTASTKGGYHLDLRDRESNAQTVHNSSTDTQEVPVRGNRLADS